MQKHTPSPGRLAIIAGFALSCFGLLVFLWNAFGGPVPFAPQGYRFAAYYRDASQLPEQADVRISGVSVGRVVELSERGGLTRAEIEMDDRYAPIPADTRTTLRLKTLLGETYLELSPGTPPSRGGRMLREGGELPVGQTKPTVELDEVLRAFDERTRKATKVLLAELALTIERRGADFNAAIGNLSPAVESGGNLASILRSQRASVRGLIRDGGTVLTALSERRGALRSLITNGSRLFEATAQRNRELTETVRIFPTFLDEARLTLALARDVGRESDPLLRELEPAAVELTPTLRDLRATAPHLKATFRDLDPVVSRSRRALPALTDILREARPLFTLLEPTLRDAVPVVHWAEDYKRELATWPVKLATALQASAGPANQHLLRNVILFTLEGLAVFDNRLGNNRHNPYSKPGYLSRVGRPHALAFDCANVSGSQLNAPPCVEQGPYNLRGRSTIFPQLREDK